MRDHIGSCAAVAALCAFIAASSANAGGPFSDLSVNYLNSGVVNEYTIVLNPGDTFNAMTTPLRRSFSKPDTYMGLFDADNNLIVVDDDAFDAPGNQTSYGSGLYYQTSDGGQYTLRITGYPDFSFDGTHTYYGRFALTTSTIPVPRGGGVFNPGDAIPITGYGSAVGFAFLDDDVHEYTITLNAGDVFTAMTTPLDSGNDFNTPDTILGVFDSDGNEITVGDDGPSGPNPSSRGSGVVFRAASDGVYTVKVTGYDDFDFVGAHTEVGGYVMTASVIPAPSAWTLLVAALVSVRRRRA